MKLYNTLTKQVDIIQPIHAPRVTVYTCGPTVYDYPHVGNWFTFIRYDLLVRSLKAGGLQPKWVMNITDVGHLVSDADDGEDKLEKGAKREGKTAWDVAKLYGDYFVEGLTRLNISAPDFLPRATDHIAEQIELVQTLESKGFTYVIDDGVYYDTSKFEGYAAFARLDLDDQQAGARVEHNPQKRNASDFALWKISPPDTKRDMEWDSPWGKGFPGWHLECSAMSMKYLGNTMDIHSGGIDHIPVHHTNEIAQSEAATGERFANYWMHTNHISVNGDKISKSLGNGITLEDIEARGFSLEAFRLHVLESHYHSQSKFSWESLQAAQNRLSAYQAMADHSYQTHPEGGVTEAVVQDLQTRVLGLLQDDLNTPEALAELSQFESLVDNSGVNATANNAFATLLQFLDDVLGLQLSSRQNITSELRTLLDSRQTARDSKDWASSDKLREELLSQGLEIKDTPRGQVWHQV